MGWTVSNTGRLQAASPLPWAEWVYFSPDPFIDAGAVPAAELTIDHDLPAGGTTTRSTQVPLPTIPGLYYTIVVVDATNVLPDLDQANNQAVSVGTVNVAPTYSVTVSTPTTIAPAGTPIQFSGTATLTDVNQPAADVPVTVRVIANGQFRRVLTATTDANGNYTVTFTPLPNEAGTYTVAAAHPSVVEDVIQAQFKLVGMSANPSSLSLQVVPGTPLTGTIEVDNLGSVPLTGLHLSPCKVHADERRRSIRRSARAVCPARGVSRWATRSLPRTRRRRSGTCNLWLHRPRVRRSRSRWISR